MSTRERWTVYPLLFLTLGIAVKDKLFRQVNTDVVQCRQLLVLDPQGHKQIFMSATPAGGMVRAVTKSEAPQGLHVVLGASHSLAGLMFTDARDNLLGVGGVLPLVASPPATRPSAQQKAHPADDEAGELRKSDVPENGPPAADQPPPGQP